MPYRSDGIGYRSRDTSARAAEGIADRAPNLRTQVLGVLKGEPGGLTSDEIAERLGRAFISIRPRVTELGNDGFVVDSGERRDGYFGKPMIVWRHRDHVPPKQMEMFQ
jgi:predicted ArsR family transcriptional regulator